MNNFRKINIAFGVTPDWQKHVRIIITSILTNANPKSNYDYHFYIMSTQFEEEEKSEFNKLKKIRDCEFHYIQMDDSYFDGVVHNWLGVSAYYRLLLGTLLPDENKVLYLDADTLVTKSIEELYSINIQDYYLAGVSDKESPMMKERVGLTSTEVFVNTGVLLINLKKFRENNLHEKFMHELRRNHIWNDQDVINLLCRGNILSLPLKYNIMPIVKYQIRIEESIEALKNPTILHYTAKPMDAHLEWKKYMEIYNSL